MLATFRNKLSHAICPPDRLLPSDPDAARLSELYKPFSLGRRNCIGQNLAMLEIRLVHNPIQAHTQTLTLINRVCTKSKHTLLTSFHRASTTSPISASVLLPSLCTYNVCALVFQNPDLLFLLYLLNPE